MTSDWDKASGLVVTELRHGMLLAIAIALVGCDQQSPLPQSPHPGQVRQRSSPEAPPNNDFDFGVTWSAMLLSIDGQAAIDTDGVLLIFDDIPLG